MMFPIFTIILLMLSASVMTNVLIITPISLIQAFSLPSWLSLLAIALLFSWFFGD